MIQRIYGASILALATSLCVHGAAWAQSSTGSQSSLGDIVVTGSRIQVEGYSQPTPVTVVGEELIQRDAKVTIGDSIRELPAVGGSASPNNNAGAANIVGGITGLDTVNLRNLGASRTLVLLDGQRVVQSNINGVVDLGTMPTILVQRIDVVTGGASAAWGSDAVAGVVNLVLNKQFDGIRASIEGGQSYAFDRRNLRVQFAAGTGFAGDRGRVIFAVSHMNSPDILFANQRKWNHYRQMLLNPAYTPTNSEPRMIHMDNVGLSQATMGGLIAGPKCLTTPPPGMACANPNPLVGIQFVGPDATPKRFVTNLATGPIASGGDAETIYPAMNALAAAFHTTNAFGYAYYDLSENLRASVQLNYGKSQARSNSNPATYYGNLPIQRDNAFLPESIRQEMVGLGLNSLLIGTTNMNNLSPDFSLDGFIHNSVGLPVSYQNRELKRGVFSLDGKIGSNWTWNAYFQHGEVRVNVDVMNNVVPKRYAFAVDAVRDPVSGNIVCRATLAGNPDAAGCVPLNVFGEGVASQEAMRYVNVRPGENWEIIRLKQQVAAISAQGLLPFGLPAGNVAMALGAEYRSEKGTVETDPGAAARQYTVANFGPFSGKYHVKEAFLEAEVPLLRDTFVNLLSLNAAGRITDYSTSGRVETWKLGLTSEISSLLRIRGTLSHDIRAPNLTELFNRGTALQNAAIDPKQGVQVPIFQVTSGNRNLKPEVANTITGGIVLSPADGLNFSLDYYRIKLRDAIYTVGQTTVLERCNAGEAAFCEQISFNAPGGVLSEIRIYPRNLSAQEVSGLDFQADWRVPLFAGTLSSRLMASYTLTQSQTALGRTFDYNGAIGSESPVQGFPKLRGTLSETYLQGPASITAQARLVGSATLNNEWGPKDVDDNSVPAILYIDLRASYDLTEHAQMFVAVDNLFNIAPPNVAMSWNTSGSYYSNPNNGLVHDQIGRYYRLGMRFNF